MDQYIDNVLVAEFDIDAGSSLTFQYPSAVPEDGNLLAEWMLPDGAHLREEDWTMFVLNNYHSKERRIQSKRASIAFHELRNQSNLNVNPVILCDLYILSKTRPEWLLEHPGIHLALANDMIYLYDPSCTVVIHEVPNSNIQMSISHCHFYLYSSVMEAVFSFKQIDDKCVIQQYIRQHNIPLIQHLLPVFNDTSIRYVINMVRTKHIEGVRRGARVKAVALVSRHRFVHIFKPLVIMALDKYFVNHDRNIFVKLFQTINTSPLSEMPLLTTIEKTILRGSDDTTLFSHKFRHNPENPQSRNKRFFECNISFEGIRFQMKIPLGIFDEELGDYSIVLLFSSFRNSEILPAPKELDTRIMRNCPFLWHPHLDTGADTHPMIILINAILTEKRVLFLGHQKSSSLVASHVLAACAIASGGGVILNGFIERCFPYTSLAALDRLLATKGYIAGVTNPVFLDRHNWWDVLFDIVTGKVYISQDLIKQRPASEPPQDGEIWGSSNYHQDFIGQMHDAIQNKLGEDCMRQLSQEYLQRFVDLAAEYELEYFGGTQLQIPQICLHKPENGFGTYFVHDTMKKYEMYSFVNQIVGWKGTWSCFLYQQSHGGGIDPIGVCLLHSRWEVRMCAARIIQILGNHEVGASFVDHMNPFLQYAQLAMEQSFFGFDVTFDLESDRVNINKLPEGLFSVNTVPELMEAKATINKITQMYQPPEQERNSILPAETTPVSQDYEKYFAMLDKELELTGTPDTPQQQHHQASPPGNQQQSKYAESAVIQSMINQQHNQSKMFSSALKNLENNKPPEALAAITMEPKPIRLTPVPSSTGKFQNNALYENASPDLSPQTIGNSTTSQTSHQQQEFSSSKTDMHTTSGVTFDESNSNTLDEMEALNIQMKQLAETLAFIKGVDSVHSSPLNDSLSMSTKTPPSSRPPFDPRLTYQTPSAVSVPRASEERPLPDFPRLQSNVPPRSLPRYHMSPLSQQQYLPSGNYPSKSPPQPRSHPSTPSQQQSSIDLPIRSPPRASYYQQSLPHQRQQQQLQQQEQNMVRQQQQTQGLGIIQGTNRQLQQEDSDSDYEVEGVLEIDG